MYFTEKGQPYWKRQARNVEVNSLFNSLDTIERLHGSSVRLYFSLLLFLSFYNGMLALCSFISWIIAISTNLSQPISSNYTFTWSFLFVATYTSQNSLNWFWTNVVLFCLVCALPTCFSIWHTLRKPKEGQKNTVGDDIVDNVSKKTRYWISVCCLIAGLSCSVAIIYGLLQAQLYVSQEHHDTIFNVPLATLMSLPVSIWFVLSNSIWDKVSFYLTKLEHNKRWLHFRISHAVKLVVFKLTLATLLYLLIAITLRNSGECSMLQGGINLFISICIDIFLVSIFVKTVLPKMWRCVSQKCSDHRQTMSTPSSSSWTSGPPYLEPTFDLSEEFLTTMYFQFLFLLTLPLMPLVGLLGIVSPLVQFVMSKWKLMAYENKDMFIQGRPTSFLFLFLLLVSIATFLSFPNGSLWLLFLPRTLPLAMQNCSVIFASPTF